MSYLGYQSGGLLNSTLSNNFLTSSTLSLTNMLFPQNKTQSVVRIDKQMAHNSLKKSGYPIYAPNTIIPNNVKHYIIWNPETTSYQIGMNYGYGYQPYLSNPIHFSSTYYDPYSLSQYLYNLSLQYIKEYYGNYSPNVLYEYNQFYNNYRRQYPTQSSYQTSAVPTPSCPCSNPIPTCIKDCKQQVHIPPPNCVKPCKHLKDVKCPCSKNVSPPPITYSNSSCTKSPCVSNISSSGENSQTILNTNNPISPRSSYIDTTNVVPMTQRPVSYANTTVNPMTPRPVSYVNTTVTPMTPRPVSYVNRTVTPMTPRPVSNTTVTPMTPRPVTPMTPRPVSNTTVTPMTPRPVSNVNRTITPMVQRPVSYVNRTVTHVTPRPVSYVNRTVTPMTQQSSSYNNSVNAYDTTYSSYA